jgi:hypothetical protein
MATNAKNLAEYLNNETTSATADIADGSITAAKLASSVNTDFDWSDSVKAANFTAVSGKGYFVNTTSAAITVTLPSSPSAGDKIAVMDYAGTADTNNITINPAGSDKVEGQTTYDLVISGERTGLELVYKDATQGWLVTNTARSNETSKVVAGFDNVTALSTFGEGGQGAATSASSVLTIQSRVAQNSIAAGATSCTVNSATGFAAGQLVLIHNTQDGSSGYNGYYEYNRISSVSGTTLNFTKPIIYQKESNVFSGTGEREVTQVVVVNEFTNLTLTGETVNADAFDNAGEGGIIAIWCSGTLTLAGANIRANTKGFIGGVSASTSNGGDNQRGMGNRGYAAGVVGLNGIGGSGGGGRQNIPGSTSQGAGGGAGHGTAGTNGAVGNPGIGGVAIGQADLLLDSNGKGIFNLGPGGGAGGYDYSNAGGNGGYGGGAIIINAKTIVSTGTSVISADAEAGATGSGGGYGGGGAGGSIAINCETITESSGTFTITAAGGGNGAQGAVGRIHIRGTNSGVSVTPTPHTS